MQIKAVLLLALLGLHLVVGMHMSRTTIDRENLRKVSLGSRRRLLGFSQ